MALKASPSGQTSWPLPPSLAMRMLLAFDDTDGPDGGCTTHMLLRVLLALPELAPRTMPRLVRLNPNIPHKTRGNGAVCVELVRPAGPQVRIGELLGHEVLAFPDGQAAAADERTLDAVWTVLETHAQPGAQPAVVLSDDAPPLAVYHQAVRTVVGVADARAAAEASGVLWRATGTRQGLVGALAAAAWPGPASSYEFIAYREAKRTGTPRAVEAQRLRKLDTDATTFHTFDADEDVPACIPSTPCPVLCGLRGLDPERLRDEAVEALLSAAREPVDAWLLWATNQASGDHVTPVADLREADELMTVQMTATVRDTPQTQKGGHVFVPLHDALGRLLTAAAFEPTKSFRDAVRALRAGDRIEAVGAWHDGTLHLERFCVVDLAGPVVKKRNPRCPQCRKTMKSHGKGAGYRCLDGHGKAPEEAAEHALEPRSLRPGWYEVPVIARRHLHKPVMFEAIPAREEA